MEGGIDSRRKMANNKRNRPTGSEKNKNVKRKGNLQVLGKIRSTHYQTSRHEGSSFKKVYLGRTRKQLENNYV